MGGDLPTNCGRSDSEFLISFDAFLYFLLVDIKNYTAESMHAPIHIGA